MSGLPSEGARPAHQRLDRDPLRALSGRGEGKLQPVEAPGVLALLPGPLPDGSSRERLDALVAAGSWELAVALLAYALPAREAVWWGCMCVTWVRGAQATEEERAALASAEAWVRTGAEAARRTCLLAGKRVTGGAAAAVAFGAHGARLGRREAPLGNQWIAIALRRVLSDRSPAERDEMNIRFIASGCDVAAGGHGRIADDAHRSVA